MGNDYPFGLKHKGYNDNVSANTNSVASKFKYNGIELEESLDLDLYEMPFRQYDPSIARFTAIDPVTHWEYSTYTAFDNNPVYFADPSGANSEVSEDGNTITFTGEDAKDAFRIVTGNMSSSESNTSNSDSSCSGQCGCTGATRCSTHDKGTGTNYGHPYAGYAIPAGGYTAAMRGADPWNPTEADAKSERDAFAQVVLFIAGEWVVVKGFQIGGRIVYRIINTKRGVQTLSKITQSDPFELFATQVITRSRKNYELLLKDIKANGITDPIIYAVKDGVKYIQQGHHRAYIAKRLGIKNVPTLEIPYKAGMEVMEAGKNPGYLNYVKH